MLFHDYTYIQNIAMKKVTEMLNSRLAVAETFFKHSDTFEQALLVLLI
jgi:hypothetical protein